MNLKQLLILIGLVAVIGTAGLLVRHDNRASWKASSGGMGQKLLPNLPVNDIAQLNLKAVGGELNLVKRDNLWRVQERNNYPANFSQISDLLVKLADIKVVQTEDIGPSQLGRLELLPPGPGASANTVKLEFKDAAGKSLGTVLLGKKHLHKPVGASPMPGMDEGWPDGRYVIAGSAGKPVTLISDSLESVRTKPEDWLAKDFPSVEKPRSIEVKFPEATNSWKLTRSSETADWQLADVQGAEKLDTAKVSGITSPLSSVSFNDVTPLAGATLTNVITLTVETFDGFTYAAKIGAKQNDNYPVNVAVTATLSTVDRVPGKDEKAEDKAKLDKEFKAAQAKQKDKLAQEAQAAGWVYTLSSYTVDGWIKPRSELLAAPPKKEEATTAAPVPAK